MPIQTKNPKSGDAEIGFNLRCKVCRLQIETYHLNSTPFCAPNYVEIFISAKTQSPEHIIRLGMMRSLPSSLKSLKDIFLFHKTI